MRTSAKLAFATIVAALTLAAVVPVSSAARFEVSNQRIRFSWTGFEFITSLASARCAVVLEGSFHLRTFTKVSGGLIGYITRAIVTRPCQGSAEAFSLNGTETGDATTLPWHIQYNSFAGALPSISSVTISVIGASFKAVAVVECLYKSTQARPFFAILGIGAGGTVTSVTADDTREIPWFSGAPVCPGTARGRGVGTVALLGTTTSIVVRLVV